MHFYPSGRMVIPGYIVPNASPGMYSVWCTRNFIIALLFFALRAFIALIGLCGLYGTRTHNLYLEGVMSYPIRRIAHDDRDTSK